MVGEVPVHVIIVAYNAMRWADRCFGSLRASVYPVHVIVVDNGSTDGTQAHLRSHYPEVELIEAGKNLGFGQGNNRGLAQAMEGGAQYMFLLNQDAWVQPAAIGALVEAMRNDAQWGVVSPLHLNGDGSELDYRFSSFVAPSKCEGLLSDMALRRPTRPVYKVPFVNAAAWMISRECLLRVGGFNPLFFHYGEDNEYTKRVAYHGLCVGVAPTAYIHHDRPRMPSGRYFEPTETELRELRLWFADPARDPDPAAEERALRIAYWRAVFTLDKVRARSMKERLQRFRSADLAAVVAMRQKTRSKGPHFLDGHAVGGGTLPQGS